MGLSEESEGIAKKKALKNGRESDRKSSLLNNGIDELVSLHCKNLG